MASQKLEDWFAKVRSGDYDAVEKLLAKKASFWKGTVKATIKGRLPEVNDVEPGTENTALHIAAEIGSVRVVEVLLEGGAEASLRNGKGDTALHAAIRANKVDIVKQLVRVKGAHTEDRTAPRIAPIDTETCLHLACQLGRSAVVETLLGCGANVDALTSSTKRTPLHLAAAGGHPDIVLALLAQGASTSAKDGSGRTPSDLAVDAKTKGAFEEYAAQRASASSSGSHGTAKKQQEAPPPPEPKKPAGPDYYELLKVPRNVSPTTLKKSFRKLAVQYHPDKNPDAKDLFQQINHAFKVLSDPQQRDVYDKHGGDAVEELIQDNLRQKQTMVQEDLDDIFGDLAKEVDSAKANTEKNAEDDLLDRVEEQLSGMGHQPQATHNSHGVTSGYDEDVDSAASRPPVVVVADVDISVLDGLLDDIALHKSGSGIDENAGGGSKFGASPSVEDASHKRPASFHPERLFGFDPTANVLDSVQISTTPVTSPNNTTPVQRPESFHPERLFGYDPSFTAADAVPSTRAQSASPATTAQRPLSFHPERLFGLETDSTVPESTSAAVPSVIAPTIVVATSPSPTRSAAAAERAGLQLTGKDGPSARPVSFHPERLFGFDPSASVPDAVPQTIPANGSADVLAMSGNDLDKFFSDIGVSLDL